MSSGAIEDFGFKCGWLRGFFDGEGSAVFRTITAGKTHSRLSELYRREETKWLEKSVG